MSIDERISEALRRLVAGMGAMRIPADPCDADLVLSDARTELATLRAQLEAVTRDLEVARIFAADREGLALHLDAATETIQYGIELRQKAERERDELRAAVCPDGGDHTHAQMLSIIRGLRGDAKHCADVVRQCAEARESEARMRAAAEFGQKVAEERGVLQGLVYWRQKAEEWRAALSAPAPEPSERMMRVAEAVVNSMDEVVRELLEEEECDCPPEWPRCALHRLALRRRTLDLRAIVAKVTP